MIEIRQATEKDIDIIFNFIKELAIYEKLENDVTATEDLILETLFKNDKADVLIANYDGNPVGMALYFYTYSTFLGRIGIYLEDLYVREEYRGKGIGKLLIKNLAKICLDNGYGRLEWSVLDWNKHSINFYESLDAKPQTEWIKYRLEGKSLKKLSEK